MFRFTVTVLFALLIPAALDAAAVRQKNISGQSYCSLQDLFAGNGFLGSYTAESSKGIRKGYSCVFNKKQRRMLCNNVKVELLSPVVYEKTHPWLTVLDWYKTIRPVLYPATVPRKKISSIMIDMGHGGSDPGALGAFSKEKMITLKVGLRVMEILRAYGFKVHATRTSDISVPLSTIGTLQKRSGSDLFVSIHVNSTANRSVTGVETFCLTPAGAASSNGGKLSKTVYSGNKNDPANMLLAWHIHRGMLKRTNAVDRGIKRARFMVLRDIDVPGVLVEIGFISNRQEEKLLNNKKYTDKIAYGIVDGIINFTRSTKPR